MANENKDADEFGSFFDRNPIQAVLGIINSFASGALGEKSDFADTLAADKASILKLKKTRLAETIQGINIVEKILAAATKFNKPEVREDFIKQAGVGLPPSQRKLLEIGAKGSTKFQLALKRNLITQKTVGMMLNFAIPMLQKGQNTEQFARKFIQSQGVAGVFKLNEGLDPEDPNKFTEEEGNIFATDPQARQILNSLMGQVGDRTGEEQRAAGLAEATAAGTAAGRGFEKIDVGVVDGQRRITLADSKGNVKTIDLGKAPTTQRTVPGVTSDLLFAKEGLTDLIKDPGVKAAAERGDLPEPVIDSLLKGIKQNNPNILQQLGVKLPGQDKKATGELSLSAEAETEVENALAITGVSTERVRQALAKDLKTAGFSPKERKDALDKFVRESRSRR